jgi:RimJ/RimL family protein N-acetyltransferase
VNLQKMKTQSRRDALRLALPIDSNGQFFLVPIGPWVLKEVQIIQLMSEWRRVHMDSFLTRFESTPKRTKTYLEEYAIKRNDRVLFLIEDSSSVVYGHLGIASVSGDSGEVDNVLKGRDTGVKSLMTIAEERLVDWAGAELGIRRLNLSVLASNFRGIRLHSRVGFCEVERFEAECVYESATQMTVVQPKTRQESHSCDHIVIMELKL